PGVPELYFVGFAPDGSQDVFLREMRYVKRLFDERFGTAGRSIALASSRDALEEFPIGSVTNLARALHRVGEAMNTEEDALFLFLSAHGDRDHRLSASQPPLELAALTPTALARILLDSGIKWRVIVVSACYSGGYVEPLRDDNTVVIAAAAPDRTSFGCEAGREFTYFGQAYFRDALARTRSFTQAFEIAKELVAKQAAAQGFDHAGGMRPALPRSQDRHRQGRPVHPRIRRDQPEQQDPVDRRSRGPRRRAARAHGIGRDPRLPRRQDRQIPAARLAREIRCAAVADVPDGRRRADLRPGASFHAREEGRDPLRQRALRQRGEAPVRGHG